MNPAAVTQPQGRPPENLGGIIVKRLDQMVSGRTRVDGVWRDCFDHSYPLRGSDLQRPASPASGNADVNIGYGSSKKASLLDSTATDGCRILASGVVSGSVPSNSRWFGLKVEGADDEAKIWLDGAADTLWENIHASNFDSVVFEGALDLVIAGQFVMFIDEDTERGGLRFELWPLAQCYFAASRPGGRIDTVYRVHSLTAEQAVNEYGIAALSEGIAKAYHENPDATFEFVHAIYPRKMSVPGARLSKNLPIASCHVEKSTKKVVRESGFHEMPCIVPRWMLIPGSHMAVGPMFECLPDVKTLNKVVEFVMTNADLAIAGMWIAEDDGVLNPRSIRIGPRKVVVANSVDSMKPLTSGSKFDIAVLEIDRLQKAIRKVLMADQLTPQDGPAMTATEVHVRVELIRQLLGPVYGRLQSEFMQPLSELTMFNDAITSGSAFDLGLYDIAANGAAAVDDNAYADAVTLVSASLTGVQLLFEGGSAKGVEDIEQFVWQDAGLTADPNKWYDLCFTGDTPGSGAGTVSLRVRYVAND